MLGAAGQRKSVSLEITGLGKLDPSAAGWRDQTDEGQSHGLAEPAV